jgi:cytochrome c-type biogenesis protein CcmH
MRGVGTPGGCIVARILLAIRFVLLTVLAGGLLSAGSAAYAVDPAELPDPVLQARYIALSHELRCMQCQNESIADSPVNLAGDLRREVREMVTAGKSDDEIRNFMVARYGEFILFRPRFSLRNAWLWLTPGVLLVIGLLAAARIVKQRSALVGQDNEPIEEDGRSS